MWEKVETYSYVFGSNIVEYHIEDGDCFIRGSYTHLGDNKILKIDGWDVLCTERDNGLLIVRVAWFRKLRDAQIWAEISNK